MVKNNLLFAVVDSLSFHELVDILRPGLSQKYGAHPNQKKLSESVMVWAVKNQDHDISGLSEFYANSCGDSDSCLFCSLCEKPLLTIFFVVIY